LPFTPDAGTSKETTRRGGENNVRQKKRRRDDKGKIAEEKGEVVRVTVYERSGRLSR